VPDGNLNTCVVGRSLPNHRRSSGRHHVDPLLVRTGHTHRRILASKETFFLHVQPLPTFITLLYHRSSCLSTQPPDLARGRGFQPIDSISPREYQQLSIRGMSLGCHQRLFDISFCSRYPTMPPQPSCHHRTVHLSGAELLRQSSTRGQDLISLDTPLIHTQNHILPTFVPIFTRKRLLILNIVRGRKTKRSDNQSNPP